MPLHVLTSYMVILRHFKNIFCDATAPNGPWPLHYRGFVITLRHIRAGRILLYESSARRRDLFLITHYTRNRQTSKSSAGFEPTIQRATERPQTYALHRAATGIGG